MPKSHGAARDAGESELGDAALRLRFAQEQVEWYRAQRDELQADLERFAAQKREIEAELARLRATIDTLAAEHDLELVEEADSA